ncbi:hypothetical protein HDE_01839 [Halotydeus destructor]|nr:hypothetical protein HDE_01839 [Halotydeus destructor]
MNHFIVALLAAIVGLAHSQSYVANVAVPLVKDPTGHEWVTNGRLSAKFYGPNGAVDVEPLSLTIQPLESGDTQAYIVVVPFVVGDVTQVVLQLTEAQSAQAVYVGQIRVVDVTSSVPTKTYCSAQPGEPLQPNGQVSFTTGQC